MSPIAVVAGVVSTVLLLLIAAACCLWKRRGTPERMVEEDGNRQGFDNIAFRDVRAGGGWHVALCSPARPPLTGIGGWVGASR